MKVDALPGRPVDDRLGRPTGKVMERQLRLPIAARRLVDAPADTDA